MMERPRLKKFLTVFPLGEHTWGIRGGYEEVWRLKLSDERAMEAFGGVLPFLDGRFTREEILRQLEKRGIEARFVRAILDHLERSSLLEEASNGELTAEEHRRFERQISFFSRYTSEGGAKYQALLREARVAVVGGGRLATSLLRALVNAGFRELEELVPGDVTEGEVEGVPRRPLDVEAIWPEGFESPPPDLFIVALEAHDPQLLEAMDAFSKRAGVQWLLLRLFDRHKGWVGPLFIPGDTASYVSLEARFRSNIPFYDEYAAFDQHLREQEEPAPSIGGLTSFIDLLSNLAVTEVVKVVTEIDIPRLAGRFLTVDLLSWDFEMHEVLRLPRLERGTDKGPIHFAWKQIPYGETQDVQTRRA